MKERALTVKNVAVKVAMYLTYVMSEEAGHQYYILPPPLDMIRIFAKIVFLLYCIPTVQKVNPRRLIFLAFFL